MIQILISCAAASRRLRICRTLRFFLSASVILFASNLLAQPQGNEPVERVYKHSKVEVEQALQSLQAYATNRLPVLDGFADANAGALAKFENPHYQFRIDIDSQGASQTLVSVSVKITAWAADSDTAQAQYVVIPSNGRLEQDLLDRLSVYLEKGSVGHVSTTPADPAIAAPVHVPPGLTSAGSEKLPTHSADSPAPAAAPAVGAKSTAQPSPTDPAYLASEIAAVEAQRQQLEANQRKLQQQISELEANSSSQKFLSNLAVVKAPQTPVYQQDDDMSKILFRADPEDEFEVLDAKNGWFHVRLENAGEGWLRAAQLQPPQEVDDTDDAAAAINFTMPNQEVKPFAGDWTPLKGKPALFVFAQPSHAIPDAILGQSQLQFAKHVFTEGFRISSHSEQAMSGVVVVFLGDKGGVAAATLSEIRRWRDGAISDKVFLERCSLDPPESFRDVPASKAVGKRASPGTP